MESFDICIDVFSTTRLILIRWEVLTLAIIQELNGLYSGEGYRGHEKMPFVLIEEN